MIYSSLHFPSPAISDGMVSQSIQLPRYSVFFDLKIPSFGIKFIQPFPETGKVLRRKPGNG